MPADSVNISSNTELASGHLLDSKMPLPDRNCIRCPRLAEYREENRTHYPDWWNSPVPSMGDSNAWLAIIGLAPGLKGGNRTGAPFTGDQSGALLFDTLTRFDLARYIDSDTKDAVHLEHSLIANAVRCLPPGNRPTPKEIQACRPFLEAELKAMPHLKVVIALGTIAHQSAIKALGGKLPKYRFEHNAIHKMPSGIILIDSYHCSQYNQNTGRLTAEMFDAVFEQALRFKPE